MRRRELPSSRLLVHVDITDRLLARIGVRMREWKMGDPLDPDNRLGAMVGHVHFDKLSSRLELRVAELLDLCDGGRRPVMRSFPVSLTLRSSLARPGKGVAGTPSAGSVVKPAHPANARQSLGLLDK